MFDGVGFYVGLEAGTMSASASCHRRYVAAFGSPYDSTNLPELDVIQELTARKSYLAHDKLVDVMGVCQFFSPSSSSFFRLVIRWEFVPLISEFNHACESISYFSRLCMEHQSLVIIFHNPFSLCCMRMQRQR